MTTSPHLGGAPKERERKEKIASSVEMFRSLERFFASLAISVANTDVSLRGGRRVVEADVSWRTTCRSVEARPNFSDLQSIFEKPTEVHILRTTNIMIFHQVFIEDSLALKRQYCLDAGASLFVMGDDHVGRFDEQLDGVCKCVYLPRTQGVSSTDIEILLKVGRDAVPREHPRVERTRAPLYDMRSPYVHASLYAYAVSTTSSSKVTCTCRTSTSAGCGRA